MKFNLEKLSPEQLTALNARIDARRAQLKHVDLAKVRAEATRLIHTAGFTVAQVFGSQPASKSVEGYAKPSTAASKVGKATVAPKQRQKAKARNVKLVGARGTPGVLYANPANPSQTWKGQGQRPKWFVLATSVGGKTEPDLRARRKVGA